MIPMGRDQVFTQLPGGRRRWSSWLIHLPGRQRPSELSLGTEFTVIWPDGPHRLLFDYAIEEVDGTARLVGRSAEIYAVDPATVTAIHRTSRLIVRAAPEGPLDA